MSKQKVRLNMTMANPKVSVKLTEDEIKVAFNKFQLEFTEDIKVQLKLMFKIFELKLKDISATMKRNSEGGKA